MLRKILHFLRKLISIEPLDARVTSIKRIFYEDNNRLVPMETCSAKLAVEGVEDSVFFGLFVSLLADLRKNQYIDAELLQIRSVNGAIGTGILAKLARSWFVASIFNKQWARISHEFVGQVAYQSRPVFWSWRHRKDSIRALQLWDEMKALAKPEDLYCRGIKIGDLVIDSYLRFKPSPKFDVENTFVCYILKQAVRDILLAQQYFEENKPNLYLSSYSTYIEHGIPVRVAISQGIPVRVYGNLTTFGKRLTSADMFHTTDTSSYRAKFEAMPMTGRVMALELAEIQLKNRLAGGIDAATSYMKVSAYADGGEITPDVAGSVMIFLHDFYDSPHIYHDLVFEDFWTWISYTIEKLSDAGIPFWLKPHPNQISLSEGVLVDLRQRFPQVRIISSKISNSKLVESGILCGVTVYGTVAHELAYLGIPTITCARHPHASFEFCRTARTVEEYGHMLSTPEVLPLSQIEMRQQALAFYYIHNLSATREESDLRIAFVYFWNTCNMVDPDSNEVANALLNLRSLPGWHEHVVQILKDINNREK